jgi:hypothetical protein
VTPSRICNYLKFNNQPPAEIAALKMRIVIKFLSALEQFL